ncbi:LPS export ABC transporter periplasmic protein LptC [Sanyastnella coralliicola]|uniref:LPS export ABC transporter periplasmic protein LptC n=1 Tax=Sanyastnella coralliicola TaxID=3069118 RepID=UPI0027B880ED|nr:LPS export ABC transporter periplasmic protein LptC [Longitalea sp. SCSIO 12813]
MNSSFTLKYLIPVALAAGIFVSCSNDIDEIKALTEDQDLAVQTVENGTYFYTSEGVLSNKLEAAVLERFETTDPRIEVSGGFTLTIYDSLEQVEATMVAQTGTFWDTEGRLIARENVILTNVDGDKLATEELIWVQDSDLVYTDKHVVITTEESVIRGKGLITDSRFKKREMKEVSGTMYIEDEELELEEEGETE